MTKVFFFIFKGDTGGEILTNVQNLLDTNLTLCRSQSELMLGGHCKQSRYRWMVVNDVLCLGVVITFNNKELNNQLKM